MVLNATTVFAVVHDELLRLNSLEDTTDAATYLMERKKCNDFLRPYHFTVVLDRHNGHAIAPLTDDTQLAVEFMQSMGAMI